jgi:hypothetical protein
MLVHTFDWFKRGWKDPYCRIKFPELMICISRPFPDAYTRSHVSTEVAKIRSCVTFCYGTPFADQYVDWEARPREIAI